MDPTAALMEAISLRGKAKPTNQQLKEVLSRSRYFLRLTDKGLLLVICADVLVKIALQFDSTLVRFMNQLLSDEKKPRVRDPNAEPRVRHPKRKGQIRAADAQSEQSLSNPSNVEQARRVEVPNSVDKINDDISNKTKSSKDSKENSKDNAFINQLTKISEDVRLGAEDTFEGGFDNREGLTLAEEPSEDSQMSVISNLAEKLKLLNPETTIHTKRKQQVQGSHGQTTKRRALAKCIVDQNTTIQQIRADTSRLPELSGDISRFCSNFEMAVEDYSAFAKKVEEYESSHLNVETIQQLKALPVLGGNSYNAPYYEIGGGQFSVEEQPDYTMSHLSAGKSYSTPALQIQESAISVDQKTLPALAAQTGYNQAQLFYQLLWRCQKGSVALEQQQPGVFSGIVVRRLE